MGLQIQKISKSFGIDAILEDISMNIGDNEKVGLIGANGAGKTTLLRIIAGDIPCDSGTIFVPKDAKIGFLRQDSSSHLGKTIWNSMMSVFSDVVQLEEELRALEDKMSANAGTAEFDRIMKTYSVKSEQFERMGGFELRTKIMTILNGMGFGGFDVNMKVDRLSGGEKTKLSMARLLLENPEILLLDEPTNHLDFKTMQWLESYLKSYRGTVVAVSHDRYFLDAAVGTIYEIERRKCTRYTGNYTMYIEQKRHNRELDQKHYNSQQKEIKHLEEYIEKNRVRASTAAMAKSRQKMLDRMDVLEKPDGDAAACKFKFDITFPSYKDVLTVDNMSLIVEKSGVLEKIASGISFEIKRGEKVALIGANGVGKSTLLKTLLDRNKNYTGEFEFGRNVEISYYDQEQEVLNEKKTVIDSIWDMLPRSDESEIRSLLGNMLFRNDDVYKLVGSLSGGEKARLLLLMIMIEKGNTLFLDEPTNHLDLPSKESLDSAVKEFPGTVFLVSHDRYFLNKTVDRIFELTPQGIVRYNGNYDDYLEAAGQTGVNEPGKKDTLSAAQSYELEKRRQANIKSKMKKLDAAEQLIENTEMENDMLNTRLEECGSDYSKASEIYKEIENNKGIISRAYEEWDKLNEELKILKNEV